MAKPAISKASNPATSTMWSRMNRPRRNMLRENAGNSCTRPFNIAANRGTTNKKMNNVATAPIAIRNIG
jgi:hypothetical protein